MDTAFRGSVTIKGRPVPGIIDRLYINSATPEAEHSWTHTLNTAETLLIIRGGQGKDHAAGGAWIAHEHGHSQNGTLLTLFDGGSTASTVTISGKTVTISVVDVTYTSYFTIIRLS